MYTDGIIFDVDGTLWDSTGLVAKAWTKAVSECGYPDRIVTSDELKGLFGKTMAVIARCLLPDATEETREKIMTKCCIYEHQVLEENETDICYPQVRQVIRKLCMGHRLFIVSNCQSGYIELFLKKAGLGDCITDIECYGNTKQGKAENMRLLVERNGLKAPVYIGDTQGDCDASREAGVPFVYASYGFGEVTDCAASINGMQDLFSMFQDPEQKAKDKLLTDTEFKREG